MENISIMLYEAYEEQKKAFKSLGLIHDEIHELPIREEDKEKACQLATEYVTCTYCGGEGVPLYDVDRNEITDILFSPMKTILTVFGETYGTLYDSRDDIPHYRDYVRKGEAMLGTKPIGHLVSFRGDYFASDRECAALYLALASLHEKKDQYPELSVFMEMFEESCTAQKGGQQ